MKKYTLAITGLPRTGTTTIWRNYGEHPEISRSRRKEPLQTWDENKLDNYTKHNFVIKNETKVLLDGSTNIVAYKRHLFEKLSNLNMFNRICCIYTLRDPLKRSLSHVNNFLRNYLRGNIPKPIFLNENNTINYHHLNVFFITILNEHLMLKMLENTLGKENIIFLDINKIFEEQQRIFFELGISDKLKIEGGVPMNRTVDLTPSIEQLQLFLKIKEWFEEHKNELIPIAESSKKKIIRDYYRGKDY
jgi:hypothetical protein